MNKIYDNIYNQSVQFKIYIFLSKFILKNNLNIDKDKFIQKLYDKNFLFNSFNFIYDFFKIKISRINNFLGIESPVIYQHLYLLKKNKNISGNCINLWEYYCNNIYKQIKKYNKFNYINTDDIEKNKYKSEANTGKSKANTGKSKANTGKSEANTNKHSVIWIKWQYDFIYCFLLYDDIEKIINYIINKLNTNTNFLLFVPVNITTFFFIKIIYLFKNNFKKYKI